MRRLFRRLRHWLAETYLPRYAYETMEDERRRLEGELADAKEQLRRQQSYIAGLQYALRYGKRSADCGGGPMWASAPTRGLRYGWRSADCGGRQDEKKA